MTLIAHLTSCPQRVLTTAAALALCGALAACSAPPASTPPSTPTAAPSNATTVTPPSAPATLTSHDWELRSMRNAQGVVQSPVQAPGQPASQLTFAQGRIALQRVCNTISGVYRTEGQQLQVQQLISTLMACTTPGVAELERLLSAQLSKVQRYAWLPSAQGRPQLQLDFADGSQWQLMGTPTPETKYGGTGERMFLEVAAQRQACTHGVMKDYQCLRVREIRYNDSGVKTYVGEWENFYGDIDGYQHRAGQRNVLRLQRFTRSNVPADASRYAYVLDMVVETEQVR